MGGCGDVFFAPCLLQAHIESFYTKTGSGQASETLKKRRFMQVKDCKDNLMTPDGGWAGAKNALLLRRFNTQTIILPRQARDKHEETLKKQAHFPQG
jgi:hypothetical protein